VSADGAATYSYALWTPQGRRGIEPNLTLAYNSRAANGPVGVGWSLQGLSAITRCKRDVARDGYNAAIQFDSTDAFCLDGHRLVSFPSVDSGLRGNDGAPGTEYRTEEDQFARVINGPIDAKGPLSFEVRLNDGRVLFYGSTQDSRLEGRRFKSTPADLNGTAIKRDFDQGVRLSWALAEVRDRFGNNMTIQYMVTGDPESLQGYEQLPQVIRYTGTVDNSFAPQREVAFEYETRPDTPTNFISGLRLQIRHRLKRLFLLAPNPVEESIVKSYVLVYKESESTARSLLTTISECDALLTCLAPTSFVYSSSQPSGFTDIDTGIHDRTASTTGAVGDFLGQVLVGDLNGDGCDDLIFTVLGLGPPNYDLQAQKRVSACYDGISAGVTPFEADPGDLDRLSPNPPGSTGSNVPLETFYPPYWPGCSDATNCNFTNQLMALDLDLDGRADLVSYQVTDPCYGGCPFQNDWPENYLTSTLLASSVPPRFWLPTRGLFGARTQTEVDTSTPASWFNSAPPSSFYYKSLYIGDINGDGYPDFVTLTPNGWSYRLNNGRAALGEPPLECNFSANACLDLGQAFFFPGSTPVSGLTNVFMTDIDRDGTTDFILRDPKGTKWYAAYYLTAKDCLDNRRFCPANPTDLSLAAGDAYNPTRRDWFVDTNGDGLPDLVSIPRGGDHPYVAINTGHGFDTPSEVLAGLALPTDNLTILDYDNNGTQDIIYSDPLQGSFLYALVTQDLTHDYKTIPILDQNGQRIKGGSSLQALDVNGDGLPDLVQVLNGTIHVYLRRGTKPDLITQITDRGAQFAVQFAPITSGYTYQVTDVPGTITSGIPSHTSGPTYVANRGLWVVRNYTATRTGSLDPAGPTNAYYYTYQDGRFDLQGRGWLGFARVTLRNNQTNAVSILTYDNATRVGTAYPFAGKLQSRETVTQLAASNLGNDRVVKTTYETKGSADGRHLTVLPREVSQRESEGPIGSLPTDWKVIRRVDTIIDHDIFGNPISVISKTRDGITEAQTTRWRNDPSAWLIGVLEARTHSSFTASQTSTRTQTFVSDPSTGEITARVVEPDGDLSTYERFDYIHDQHGLITNVTIRDLAGKYKRVVTFGFDSEGLYVNSVTNTLGHTEQFATHPAFGVIAAHADVNGATERSRYDGFGRLVHYSADTGAQVDLSYSSPVFPTVAAHYRDGHTFGISSDAYLNQVERHWTGFDGSAIKFVTIYNDQGLIAEQDGSCRQDALVCNQSGVEYYKYDELGRTTDVVHADATFVKATYNGLRTTVQDEVQNRHYFTEDQLGRVTESVAISDSGSEIAAKFSYGAFGSLLSVTDPAGHPTELRYDVRGRMTTITEADSGTRSLRWSALSELEREQDGSGVLAEYQRDLLGRIETIHSKDGVTTFCWDTAANGIGRLNWAESPNKIRTEYAYDALGRVKTVGTMIGGSNYAFDISYDPVGRIDTLAYPANNRRERLVVRQQYNKAGYTEQVSDAQSGHMFWRANSLDTRSNVTDETSGDGVHTTRHYDTRGFLRDITIAGADIQRTLGYVYYPNGSLQSRSDNFGKVTVNEFFSYDRLDRLHEWTLSTKTGATAPQLVTDQLFSYDTIGNLLQRSTLQGIGPTLRYQYGQNSAGPQAVTEVNSDTYEYDSRGDQIGGPGRTAHYSAFELPAKIDGHDNALFGYDSLHQRSTKTESSRKKTAYVGQLYERRSDHGKRRNVSYVLAPGHVIAQQESGRSKADVKTLYLHGDYLGSTIAVTSDPNGAVTSQVEYEPFGSSMKPGQPMTAADLGSVTRGFTGQSEDRELHLIDMKGRIYDPTIARFLTPDPLVQAPLWTESLNRYSYAWNNPLKWVDPTGFQAQGGGDTSGGAASGGELGSGLSTPDPRVQALDPAVYWESAVPGYGLDLTNETSNTTVSDNGFMAGWTGPTISAETNPNVSYAWQSFTKAANGRWVTLEQLEEARAFLERAETGAYIANGFAASGAIGYFAGGDEGARIGYAIGNVVGAGAAGVAAGASLGASASHIEPQESSLVLKPSPPVLRYSQEAASPWFHPEGTFAGKTISDIAGELRAGILTPASVPVRIVPVGPITLIVETRSSLALTRAGVPQDEWNLIDVTGNGKLEGDILGRLVHNNLGISGTDVITITGSGKNASTVVGGGNLPAPILR
jgi:RHS repeat-associated protein